MYILLVMWLKNITFESLSLQLININTSAQCFKITLFQIFLGSYCGEGFAWLEN